MLDYFSFDGRCTRKQFWLVQFLSVFVSALIFALSEATGESNLVVYTAIALTIAFVILQWSTVIRRLRDTGANPYWSILTLVPYLGAVWFVIIGFLPPVKDEA